ncbi:cytochrome C [Pelotalea chapellei]|uniref:Cytochrome C n=1 Tax=Pelotalea chapellei TaxID=44671 RepID=A0ABS5UCV2_9BACT|nr:cytochrome C [Pelotalea chapellei]MBT1073548.1 cytochrome C [Pelotalea chapellei]
MRRIVLLGVLLLLIFASLAEARIKVSGKGYLMNFDPASIPDHLKVSYDIMSRKCVLCHTLERTVIAVQTGRAPITGQPFDRQAVKAYGIKMLNKSNSDMNRQEIKEIVMLLNYLVDENSR